MAESIIGELVVDVHLLKIGAPDPSTHPDPRMHLTLADMYASWGEKRPVNPVRK